MSIFKKIRGTLETIWQLGLGGPNIKNNSGVVEMKNSDDSALAVIRFATPVADTDGVNKIYADSLEKPLIVGEQANCSAALPNNTGARGWVVVSTAGTGAVIGDVLYDDGSGSGTMAIVGKVEGRMIAITDALAGGTATFDTDSTYIWDEDGSVWVKIGDIGSVTGAVRTIRFALDNSASQDSTSQIPANARLVSCDVKITTPYTAGATITVGSTSTATMAQETTDNNPQANATYSVDHEDTAWEGTASVVRVAVATAPAAGVGVCTVRYCNPNV